MAKIRKDFEEHWATPSYVYDTLNDEFRFDHDPCPLLSEEEIEKNNGLIGDWGESNYVNPPYKKDPKADFVRKAVEQFRKGKLVVMLLPVSTSTILFHEVIFPNVSEIRLVKKRIKFIGVNSKGECVDKSCGMADSMICIFDPKVSAQDRPIISTQEF